MSIEALWSVTFLAPTGSSTPAGQGIMVLETGRVLGGDSGHTYIGTYKHNVQTGRYEAVVRVKKYGPFQMPNVLGPIDDFDLLLQGTLQADGKLIFSGHVKDNPNATIMIEATCRAVLP